MGFWGWLLVFFVIGLLALVLYAVLGLQLWHKSKQLMGELARLTQTVEAAELAMRPADGEPSGAGGHAPEPEPSRPSGSRGRGRRA